MLVVVTDINLGPYSRMLDSEGCAVMYGGGLFCRFAYSLVNCDGVSRARRSVVTASQPTRLFAAAVAMVKDGRQDFGFRG
jgi:hypothetical protein